MKAQSSFVLNICYISAHLYNTSKQTRVRRYDFLSYIIKNNKEVCFFFPLFLKKVYEKFMCMSMIKLYMQTWM